MSRPSFNPRVSVVMVARNAGGSVRRAVESLQRQTLSDFELLVVDDGSSDGTASTLDRMAEKDLRITVIHEPNVGLVAARNNALAQARGSYLVFVDADAWVEPSTLSDLVGLLERERLQLAVAGLSLDTPGKGGELRSTLRACADASYPTQAEFRSAAWQLLDAGQLDTVAGKLFDRARVEALGLRFGADEAEANTQGEAVRDGGDLAFVLAYLHDVERVGVASHPYHHLVQTKSQAGFPRWEPGLYERCEVEHGQVLELYRHWGLDGDPASMDVVQRRYLERLIGCIVAVSGRESGMSAGARRAMVEQMIGSDRAQLAAQVARPSTRLLQAMLLPIRTRNANFALTEARFLSLLPRALFG